MINEMFKNKVPFVYDYFSNLLDLINQNKKTFPQAIIFEGMDTKLQFLFSLELARILNCKETKEPICSCTNCRWIKNLEHPSVNLVSQIHFKPDGDETKTVISVKQANLIEKTLTFSSDYYRFFIFFSSALEQNNNEIFEKYGINKEIDFKIEPIENKTFNPNALNALLKSVEEPPKNTCFIFLTKSKEDILQTIVSRCQIFKIGKGVEKIDYSQIQELIKDYFKITYDNAFDISSSLLDFAKENEIDAKVILNMLLSYLETILKENVENNGIYLKLSYDIKLVNLALKQLRASINEKIVFDSLFLSIAKGI